MAERQPSKLHVAGSIPVSRSTIPVSSEPMRPLPPPYDSIAAGRPTRIPLDGATIASGLARPNDELEADLDAAMWWPAYVPYLPA